MKQNRYRKAVGAMAACLFFSAPLNAINGLQDPLLTFGYGKLTCAALSPDGSILATGSFTGTIRLWNCATGKVIKILPEYKPSSDVRSLAFSPDGKTLASGDEDTIVKLWNVGTGKLEYAAKLSSGWSDYSIKGITSVTYSQNGTVFASTVQNVTFLNGDSNWTRISYSSDIGIWAFAVSSDESKLAICKYRGALDLWDLQFKSVIRAIPAYSINDVVFMPDSPDGMKLLTAGEILSLWDARTGDRKKTYGDSGIICCVAISSDASQILSGFGRDAILYDAYTGKKTMTFSGHTDTVVDAGFSSDNKKIFTRSTDNTVRLWDVNTGKTVQTFIGHTPEPSVMAFSPDGQKIFSGSIASGYSARMWNAATGNLICTFSGHTDMIRSAAFSSNGEKVITGSMDSTARLWDANTGDLIKIFRGHTGGVNSVAFSPDGESVLTGSNDKTARLWNSKSGISTMIFSEDTAEIKYTAFFPNGEKILTCSRYGTVRIWNAGDGSIINTKQRRWDSLFTVAVLPDNERYLISKYIQGYFGEYPNWQIVNSKTDSSFSHLTEGIPHPRVATVSPDGKKVVTLSIGATQFDLNKFVTLLLFWNSVTDSLPSHIDCNHPIASTVAPSYDAHYAVTGSNDGVIRLWSNPNFASVKRPAAQHPIPSAPRFCGIQNRTLVFSVPWQTGRLPETVLHIYKPDGVFLGICSAAQASKQGTISYRLMIPLGPGAYMFSLVNERTGAREQTCKAVLVQ
jgi:WD40 repeat protein